MTDKQLTDHGPLVANTVWLGLGQALAGYRSGDTPGGILRPIRYVAARCADGVRGSICYG